MEKTGDADGKQSMTPCRSDDNRISVEKMESLISDSDISSMNSDDHIQSLAMKSEEHVGQSDQGKLSARLQERVTESGSKQLDEEFKHAKTQ